MRLAGKLDGRGGSTDTSPGSGSGCFHIAAADNNTAAHNHHLFFLRDNDSGRRFLIDTSSSFSILPYRSAAAVFGPRLRASRFSVPAALTSDRGVQLTSSFWAVVMGRLGVRHNTTTAFHPQSNGMVERFHRRLKEALKARAASTDWPAHLPWVMLGLRTSPREESGVSAAELVYGSPLSLPGQLLSSPKLPPEKFVRQLQSGVPWAAPLQPRGADAGSSFTPHFHHRRSLKWRSSSRTLRGPQACSEVFRDQDRRSI
jgi:transposase InsO family protein